MAYVYIIYTIYISNSLLHAFLLVWSIILIANAAFYGSSEPEDVCVPALAAGAFSVFALFARAFRRLVFGGTMFDMFITPGPHVTRHLGRQAQ